MNIRYYAYEQPDILREVFRAIPWQVRALVAELAERPPRRVFLVGSGSSRNALAGIQPMLAGILPCCVVLCSPLEFGRQHASGRGVVRGAGMTSAPSTAPAERDVALFLSQSGASAGTVDAVRLALNSGLRTAVITAEPESPIGFLASHRITVPVGSETVGPKTKGYTASVATLLCLLAELEAAMGLRPDSVGDLLARLDAACEAIRVALPVWEETGYALAATYRSAGHIMVLGEGPHLATALEGSLKISEMSGVASSAFEIEEGLHGRFHGLDRGDLALFVTGSTGDAMIARSASNVLSDLGIPSVLIGPAEAIGDEGTGRSDGAGQPVMASKPEEAVPQSTLSLREVSVELAGGDALRGLDLVSVIIPLQFFAYHLATEHGRDPDRMRYTGLSSRLGIKIR